MSVGCFADLKITIRFSELRAQHQARDDIEITDTPQSFGEYCAGDLEGRR
jgi:hypothetical protein